MSMPVNSTSRRNGRLASCESCRKGKIRCDHQRPVCGRCQRRGAASKCYYHPNPLTKPRQGRIAASPLTPPVSDVHQTVLQDDLTSDSLDLADLTSPINGPTPTSGAHTTKSRQVQAIAEVLSCLSRSDIVHEAIKRYTATAQVCFSPAPLLVYASSSLHRVASTFDWQDGELGASRCKQVALQVLEATTQPITITPDLDYRMFCDLFIASNLRLEMMGLLFAVAARGLQYKMVSSVVHLPELMEQFYNVANTCVELSRELAPEPNDVMTWLSYEILRAATLKNGNLHSSVWYKVGDISSDIFALGVHRESFNSKDVPFFLAESRRKLFCCVYNFDKTISAIFDRPPRIMKGYGDCKLPLDLSDDALVADPETVEAAKATLTPDGWSSEGKYHSVTWARLRYLQSDCREKVIGLSHSHTHLSAENVQRLRDLAQESMRTWDSLPSHLKYRPEMFGSEVPPQTVLMVAVVYLLHLQTDFQIHRILQKRHPEAADRLIELCAETIAVVVHMGGIRSRDVFLRHDNAYVMICYGLPCAATLLSRLRVQSSSPASDESLPGGLSRPRLLRNLAVFISYLEFICTPEEGNYLACIRAAKALGRALDEILKPSSPGSADTGQPGRIPTSAALGPSGVKEGFSERGASERDADGNTFSDRANGGSIQNSFSLTASMAEGTTIATGPATTRASQRLRDTNISSSAPLVFTAPSSTLGVLTDMDMPDIELDPHALDVFDFDAWMKGIDWSTTTTTADWNVL